MKSILKKTLGVLVCLLFVPAINVGFEAVLKSEPNYIQAFTQGLMLTVLIAIGAVIGWQLGKILAWCFS
jgi:hypothetical protein